ncbi:DUF6932 family protein [Spirosoma arcticum]
MATVERVFVEEFAESATRWGLFVRYQEYVDQLRAFMPGGFSQWVDGSFVGQKLNPTGIDFVTFVDYRIYQQNEPAIDNLRRLRLEWGMGMDGYFVKTYPDDHPEYRNYRADLIEWEHRFSRTRDFKHKGFIELIY